MNRLQRPAHSNLSRLPLLYTQDTHLTHTRPHTVLGAYSWTCRRGGTVGEAPSSRLSESRKPPAAPVSKTGVMEGASPSSPRAGPVWALLLDKFLQPQGPEAQRTLLSHFPGGCVAQGHAGEEAGGPRPLITFLPEVWQRSQPRMEPWRGCGYVPIQFASETAASFMTQSAQDPLGLLMIYNISTD